MKKETGPHECGTGLGRWGNIFNFSAFQILQVEIHEAQVAGTSKRQKPQYLRPEGGWGKRVLDLI